MKSFNSLKDIEARKESLRENIRRGNKNITRLSTEIFVPKKPDNRKEMVSRAVNIGFMVFDGIMLAKKLDSKYAIVMKSIELIRKLKK
jgi:hypothetical protein